MKSGWQYVNNSGTNEKMAPMTVMDNVLTSENGLALASILPPRPNMLINGDFKVWQRGTSFTGSSAPEYKCDRWTGSGNLFVNASKHAYGMYMEAATSGFYMGISQRIEMTTMEAYQFIGKAFTLSYKLRGNQGFKTYQGNIVPAYTDFVETNSFTFTQSNYDFVAANGYSDLIKDRIGISALADGSVLPIGFWAIFEWVKLEQGSAATPFVPRTYAEELAMCQRYYYDFNPSKQAYFSVSSAAWGDANANYIQFDLSMPVCMRKDPSLVRSGNYQLLVNGGDYTSYITSVALNRSSLSKVQVTISLSRTVGAIAQFTYRANNDVTANFALDAEI